MGCCVASALCCAGQACCGLLCKPCAAAGVGAKNYAKIGYTFFQVVWMGIALILFFLSDKLRHYLPDAMYQCQMANYSTQDCLAIQVVGRMSFVLFCLSLLVFLVILARNEMAANFHDGCWAAKALFVAGGFVASWWMPASFFNDFYLPVAKWVSAIFLVYQAFLMLVVAYKVNETLVGNYNRDQTRCSSMILLAVTLSVFGGNIVWIVDQYVSFKCSHNIVYMTITLLGIILFYVAVFLKSRADSSILTSSIAALYCLYLQWSALSSDPQRQCNANLGTASNTTLQIIFGMLFTFVALFIVSGTSKTGDEPEEEKTGAEDAALIEDNENKDGDDYKKGEEKKDSETKRRASQIQKDDEDEDGKEGLKAFPVSTQTIYFQLLMLLASMYYAMLCTNWLNPALFKDNNNTVMASETTFWLKMVCEWLTILVYLFSMIAPILFPGRNFS